MAVITYREAVAWGIAQEMRRDPTVVFLGEDVAAWIVTKPGAQVSAEELRAFLAELLADYKVPRRWTFVDELPRNATGKVLKQQLTEA